MSVEGVHFVKATRPGKPTRWYIYAWRGGPRIGEPVEQRAKPKLTPALLKLISDAHETNDAPPDTLAGLEVLWTASDDWKSNAASTRETWGYSLAKIGALWGQVPLRLFGDPRMTAKVVKWRDQVAEASGKRSADIGITVLTRMCAWGMLQGKLLYNPAAPVPPLWQGGNREEIIWTAEDCVAFDAVPKIPQWLVDARRLAEFTGLRRTDLCRLEWQHVTDTHIAITAAKKSRGKRKRVVMPIVPGLRDLLDELRTRHRAEGVEAVLVAVKGHPVKPTTLTAEFNRYRKQANGGTDIVQKAEFEDEQDRAKHLHDIRGTFATKLMTLPGGTLTDDQIAMIMGWGRDQVAAIRQRYVDEAAIVIAISDRIQRQDGVKPVVKRGAEVGAEQGENRTQPVRSSIVKKLGRPEGEGYIYFLGEEDGPIKIGFTRSLKRRLYNLSTASPRTLVMFAVQKGTIDLEQHYHARFAAHRIRGEWYARHPEIEELIASLNAEPEAVKAGIA